MNKTGIYIARGDDTLGPYEASEAAELVKRGDLLPNDFAARNGDAAWVPLSALVPAEKSAAPASEVRAAPSAPRPTLQTPSSPVSEVYAAQSVPVPVLESRSALPASEIRPVPLSDVCPAPPLPAPRAYPAPPAPKAEIRANLVPVSEVRPTAIVTSPAVHFALPDPAPTGPEQKQSWPRRHPLLIFLVALLVGGLLPAVRWLTYEPAAHQAVTAKPVSNVTAPAPRPTATAKNRFLVVAPLPGPFVKSTSVPATPAQTLSPLIAVRPAPAAPSRTPGPNALTNPPLLVPNPSANSSPLAQANPTPTVSNPVPTPLAKGNESPAGLVLVTPAPGVLPPTPAPEEKSEPLHGAVSLEVSDGSPVKFDGVRVSAYPLSTLATFLAPKQAQVEAELTRLAPQIEAAEAERTARIVAEHTAQQAMLNAPSNDLRASLRFAYAQAKGAVKTAESDYRYLLDQRAEALDGEIYFRDLPPAVATTETNAEGEFSLELPPGGPFALAAAAQQTTAEGPRTRYWLVKIPMKREERRTFSLTKGNVASSGAAESLIQTAN